MMNRNKKAAAQLTALGLISGVLISLAVLCLPRLPSSPMLKDRFWAIKTDLEPRFDIVAVGDSRIYRGIDPALIMKEFPGYTCYNMGFSSAGLDTQLLELAFSVLNPEGAKIILMGVSPNSFMPSSLENGHLQRSLQLDRCERVILKKWYPFLSAFDSYRISDLLNAVKGEGYFEHFYDNGFVASARFPSDSNSALPAYRAQFLKEQPDSAAVSRFLRKLQEFRHQGCRVFLFRMPVSHALLKLEDEMSAGFFAKLSKRLIDSGFTPIPLSNDGLYLYDGSHLDSRSAAILTQRLTIQLSERLGN